MWICRFVAVYISFISIVFMLRKSLRMLAACYCKHITRGSSSPSWVRLMTCFSNYYLFQISWDIDVNDYFHRFGGLPSGRRVSGIPSLATFIERSGSILLTWTYHSLDNVWHLASYICVFTLFSQCVSAYSSQCFHIECT